MSQTNLMRRAMMHIADAITDLSSMKNKGIDNGATDKLKEVYEWLGATADVLDNIAEIEQIGDKQR